MKIRALQKIVKNNNDSINHASLSKHSMNETKRKKLMNVLEDLIQLRKKLDNK